MDNKYKKINKFVTAEKDAKEKNLVLFQDILNSSRDILYRFNFKTQSYDYLSKSVEEVSGFSLEEIAESGQFDFFQQLIHPDDIDIFNTNLQVFLNNPDPNAVLEMEYRVRRKDGTYIWHSDVSRIIRDRNGNPEAIVGCSRDITEHKQRESESQMNHDRFERLSEAAFEGILIHDKGMIIDANPRFLKMYGCSSLEEIVGMDCFKLIAPQSHEMVRNYIETGFQGPYEAFAMTMDGAAFPVEVRARELQQDGKQVRIATFRDLTEQKELEQQLTDNERKYKELYENSPAALYRTRIRDGKIMMCNTALAKLMGYDTSKEFIQSGVTAVDCYVDQSKRQELLVQLKKNNRIDNFKIRAKRKDGRIIWISLTAELKADQKCMEGVIKDITLDKVLTKTEKKVLNNIMQGLSNKEVARKLGRSVRTVEDHRSSIMHKLGVDNALDLAKIALKHNPEYYEH